MQMDTRPVMLSNIISVMVPDELDKSEITNNIIELIENMKIKENDAKQKMLFQNKSINDILHDLNNNVTKEYIENVIKFCDVYNADSIIRLIIQYYACHFNINIKNKLDILTRCESRLILGLLLHIPADILFGLYYNRELWCGHINTWIIDELAYYRDNKTIRIDEICKNFEITHDIIIIDYLKLNYAPILQKYDKYNYLCNDISFKMTKMKDLLKI